MKDIVQQRLEKYNCKSSDEEMMALKEITQEVALNSLGKVGFFKEACFLGGTALRIVHGLDRFSEDLDFSTNIKNKDFDLDYYLNKAIAQMNAFGYDISTDNKDLSDLAVKGRFLKDDSIKKVLTFNHHQDLRQIIKIKIEIDTNPPLGAIRSVEYIDFPEDFAVACYNLESLMAGKLHALLCRKYTKGRDFYDFLWYSANKVSPNIDFLSNALNQTGPFAGENKIFDINFVKEELVEKIEATDWDSLKLDIRKFLNPQKAKTLDLWGVDFFKNKIDKL